MNDFERDIEILRELQSEINHLNGIKENPVLFTSVGAIVWKRCDNDVYGNIKVGKVILVNEFKEADIEWFEEGHVTKCINRLMCIRDSLK